VPVKKVLIVENDPINMLIARKFLENRFEVDTSFSGEKALEMISEKSYDVVVMDINLGEDTLDGIEAMKRIRLMPDREKTAVFAITSYAMPEDKDRFLNLGFDEYFAKPYDKNILIKAIEEFDS
jgi:two-component system cell cycle response regulator DivK